MTNETPTPAAPAAEAPAAEAPAAATPAAAPAAPDAKNATDATNAKSSGEAAAPAAPKGPRPYVNPYVGGALLGVVLFLSFYVTGGGLGASAAITRVQTGLLDLVAPAHVDRVAYFASLAGGSRSPWVHYAVFMALGTFLGGLASGVFNRRFKLETRRGPRVSVQARWALALLGGAIMGYGARLARGCTSGQALSGGATLSVGSWAFALTLFATGYAVAWFFRRLWT